MTDFLDTPQGRRIAYNLLKGKGPGVVFLGGFKSDMSGTKAMHLEHWARGQGRGFLRFDYSGHGDSSGAFEEGCIGEWFADAAAALTSLTEGPQILVGSSMGGWIALLLARTMPQRVAGLVTIAAAPDFSEQGFWAGFDAAQREVVMRDGRIEIPSEYDDAPYVITRKLIEDGRDHLVMNQSLVLPFPTRLLQGTADEDVPVDWALALLDHAQGEDIRLTLVKGADHRFSSPDCLGLIEDAVTGLLR
ncbi:alpha/beta hydrolase [Paracoccus methylarcula]|uniref:Palmitoyl-protein thioesterase ABHD10, mitochondrial n=1 Tax=Paracoccus methylarcula TaxID=72022 RepID=A0A3R7LP39_9RHOB|nr:alpha/beta hydrolase [Paracoccus methylarcula]RNF33963.1 alpha/beta hydrolase [Paracoccus methylarcula]